MKKVFITNMPLQPVKGELEKVVYQPVDFSVKNANRETSFPIIPVVEEYLQEQGETQIIAIRTENDATKAAYQTFLTEVETLGLDKNCVCELVVPEQQTPEVHKKLMVDLIDLIPEHTVVNACITYGTKPMSVIVTYVLKYILKILIDVEIGGIYYGEIKRGPEREIREANLYNLSYLLEVGELVEQMDMLDIQDKKRGLKRLLGIQ